MAAAALEAGADLVNDHTGLSDPEHGGGRRRGRRRTGDHPPRPATEAGPHRHATRSLSSEIAEFLTDARRVGGGGGGAAAGILIDPGLGFGKDIDTDLDTLRHLPTLIELGYPVLLACSHKEVTAAPLGLPESALEGTAAVTAVAAYLGVAVLRLHDLPFMAHAARMGWLMRPPRRQPVVGGASDGAKNDSRNIPSRWISSPSA